MLALPHPQLIFLLLLIQLPVPQPTHQPLTHIHTQQGECGPPCGGAQRLQLSQEEEGPPPPGPGHPWRQLSLRQAPEALLAAALHQAQRARFSHRAAATHRVVRRLGLLRFRGGTGLLLVYSPQ